jgi:hypothetical protein
MIFDLCNCSLKIWECIRTPTPKVGVHLGVWRFNSHTLPYSQSPGSMKCDSQAFLLACTFASPCLGHEPKARVTIGRWWLPPSPGHGESSEFMFAHGSSMHQKCSCYALTNLLFGLCRSMWVIYLLVILFSPILELQHAPLSLKCCESRSVRWLSVPLLPVLQGDYAWKHKCY